MIYRLGLPARGGRGRRLGGGEHPDAGAYVTLSLHKLHESINLSISISLSLQHIHIYIYMYVCGPVIYFTGDHGFVI